MVISEGVQIEPSHEAVYACHYFHEVCAPNLVNYGSASFWNCLVLQACQTDEGIKHLVIAASQLDMQTRQPTWSNGHMTSFQLHYGKGLRLMNQPRCPDAASLLIACLVLILCDELQRNHFSALQHLIAGRKIVAAYYPFPGSPTRNMAIEEIGQIFSKLELETGEFHQQLVPPHSRLPTSISNDPAYADNILHLSPLDALSTFDSIEESAVALQAIASDCTRSRLHGIPPRTRFHVVASLTANLNNWYARFTTFERNLPTDTARKKFRDLNLLRTYHLCLHVISRCAPFDQELAFDGYATNIELIMVSCNILMARPLTTTAKLLPPLFFVATKYRCVSYRRRAVEALKRCGPDGQLLADIAMRIIRVEERGVDDPIVCPDIPEQKRIQIQRLELDSSAQIYTLYFKRHLSMENVVFDHLIIPSQGWVWSGPGLISHHAVRFPVLPHLV
jgi:hypothetical protein